MLSVREETREWTKIGLHAADVCANGSSLCRDVLYAGIEKTIFVTGGRCSERLGILLEITWYFINSS